MTSNTSSSDRRWASTRRGGMTVLGKVAVPKPINLPSQRLENHGLDPNVEIVPKGTLSWGSRSSPSTSNPWVSSALSPNTDCGPNSPGRISNRPSSGETRPSTAGSDRVHESTPSAWSSNSRPSSASGALTSSQTSLASLRPRSAETRPSSSQLSRFADLPPDTSASRIGEKLGAASSKNDGFALTTGDFPTLGSVKSSSGKTADSIDHNSSSADSVPTEEGTINQDAGDAPLHNDGRSKVDNAWRRDSDDSHTHALEKWNGDPLHYQNSGIPPQHFGAWHGPSLNNPQGGVWFRGPPGGPPPFAGGPIPPGGFPMEPFPYFRPQLPTNARPNTQPPGNGPRGPHPNNGEMYRPHMPDAYMRPAMPMRPGFYPGPVTYDGYFGPPMGYCNPNERDIPLINMGGGPQAIYGQFPNQNAPDPRNSHVRSPGYGPNSKDSNLEGVDSGRHRDGPEQRKLLLKDHDGWGDEKAQEHKQEGIARTHESSVHRGECLATSSWDDWEGDREKVTELSRELSSGQFERKDGRSNLPLNVKTPEHVEVSRVDRAVEKRSDHKRVSSPDTPKDSTLIQKIQGLNAKARAADGRQEVMAVSDSPGQGHKHISDAKFSSVPESGTSLLIGSVQLHSGFPIEEKRPLQTVMGGANSSRRHPHDVQIKGPHRAKGRYNSDDGDGWQKRSAASVNSDPILPSPAGASSVLLQPRPASPMATGISASCYPQKDDRASLPGPPDNQAERAKMRELARQRVKQRQEEEEQRIRDQKAKARLKLEELERRRQVVEGSKTEPENGNQLPSSAEATVTSKSTSNPAHTSASNSNVVVQTYVSVIDGDDKSSAAGKESSLQQDDGHINSTKVPVNNNSKLTRSSDKPKLNRASDSRSYIPKPVVEAQISEVAAAAENATTSIEVITKEITTSFEANISVGSGTMADSTAHHKRKFNKNGRNKFKVDESASAPSLPLTASKEASSVISSADGRKSQQASESDKDLPVQTPSKPADGSQQITEQRPTSGSEEVQGKVNNQSKSQQSRRTPRNQQGSRASEKFHGGDAVVWAPVRSQNKTEVGDEPGEKVERLSSSARSDNVVAQNSLRNKRAEMERYVPKPVAKEMAQHVVGVHQNTSVADVQVKEEDGDAVQRGDVRLEKEARNLDGGTGRQSSKSGRGGGHESWQQRGPVVHHQGIPVRDEQSQSDTARIVDNHDRQQQQHMPERNIGKEELSAKYHDDWVLNEEPSSNSTIKSAPQEAVAPVVRDHQHGVGGGKGRRYASKGQKAVGGPPAADMDQKKSSSRGDTEIRSSNNSPLLAPETNAAAAAAPPKENHGTAERNALHWKPKSRAAYGHNYRVVNREELGGGAPLHEKDNKTAEPEEQRPVNSSTGGSGYSRTPNRGGSVKPPSDVREIVDHQEGGFSSGPRRNNGSQNFRPGSSDGNRAGEWNSNSRQHSNNNTNAPPPHPPQGGHRGERQRYNSQQQQQLKYQPVGVMHQQGQGGDNRSSSNQFEGGGSRDGPPGGSRRYKERGGGQGNFSSRRGGGNFYERQGVNDG